MTRIGDNLVKQGVVSEQEIQQALSLQKTLREGIKSCFIDVDLNQLESEHGSCVNILIRNFGEKIFNLFGNSSFLMGEILGAIKQADIAESLLKAHKELIVRNIIIHLDKLLDGLISNNNLEVNLDISNIYYDQIISKTNNLESGMDECMVTNLLKGNFSIIGLDGNKVGLPIPFEYDTQTKQIIVFDTNSNVQMMLRIVKNLLLKNSNTCCNN